MFLLAFVATFSEQLHFRKICFFTVSNRIAILHSCYFFAAETLLDLSLFLSSYFLQNSNVFRVKLLRSSHLSRIDSSLGQLLFRRTNFVQNKDICRRATFLKQVLLWSITISEQLPFQQS